MTLRARLTLFFIGIVIVPLVAMGILVQALASRQNERQTEGRLRTTAATVTAAEVEREDRAMSVTHLVAPNAFRTGAAGGSLDALRKDAGLDYLVVLRGGALAASSVGPSQYLPGIPIGPALTGTEPPPPALVAGGRVTIEGEAGSEVRGGFFIDRAFLREAGLSGAAVWNGRVTASTVDPPPSVMTGRDASFDAGHGWRGLFKASPSDPRSGIALLVRTEPGAGLIGGSIVLLLGVGLLAATGLAYVLARLISRPLQRVAEGALAVARGDLGQTLPAEGRDDVAKLGAAFNTMIANLRRNIGALEDSRDELRRNLSRLGETLSATHDLEGMLGVILDTAASTLGAPAGAVYLRAARRRELVARVTRGIEGRPPRLRLGEGLAGAAAEEGVPLLIPDGAGHRRSPKEPHAPTALAVALSRGGRSLGALVLYGRTTGEAYTEDDLRTLTSFATQASVAIEKVFLHEATERLSITDPLTGVANRRYLDTVLAREVDRAKRFGHPLSLLMIDLDHFKVVNDRFGHRRGDAVLGELCRRIQGSIRSQIDTLARYGGEEFTIVLPETDCAGALVVAEKIRRVVRSKSFGRGNGPVRISVSVGAAAYPEDGSTPDDLTRAADRALYRAKEGGRNRVAAASKA